MSSELIEFGISVAQYLRSDDPSEAEIRTAFKRAATDKKRAVAYAKDDLKRLRVPSAQRKRLRFRPEFLEFDSGNYTHAGAMWRVWVTGPADATNAVSRAIDREVMR